MTTHFGSRKERWLLERWPAIRARGSLRFIFARGLTWGGLMAVALGVMVTLQLGVDHPRLPMLLVVDVLLCAVGGLFWGVVAWWINERLFRSLTSDSNP